MALSKSLPTPNTSDLLPVVTSEAVGAPAAELPPAVAPIAPEPFVPVVSTFEKVATVIDAAVDCESVAVTVTFVSVAGAKALQISAVPLCTFVRLTSARVKPPPATPVTVVFVPVR